MTRRINLDRGRTPHEPRPTPAWVSLAIVLGAMLLAIGLALALGTPT